MQILHSITRGLGVKLDKLEKQIKENRQSCQALASRIDSNTNSKDLDLLVQLADYIDSKICEDFRICSLLVDKVSSEASLQMDFKVRDLRLVIQEIRDHHQQYKQDPRAFDSQRVVESAIKINQKTSEIASDIKFAKNCFLGIMEFIKRPIASSG